MLAIVKNLKGGLVTMYEYTKDMYKDFMDRDLGVNYIDRWEGWFSRNFLRECSRHRNKNFVVICEEGEIKKCPIDSAHIDYFGLISIDSVNRIVEIRIKKNPV